MAPLLLCLSPVAPASPLDARSPLSVARQFEQAIADTELVVIPDCGHVSNLEQPEQFNEAVRKSCRAHSQH